MCKECGKDNELVNVTVEVVVLASIVDGELRPFENLAYLDEGKIVGVRYKCCDAKVDMDGMTVRW